MKASADEIQKSIRAAGQELLKLGLLADQNESVVENLDKSRTRVTWSTTTTRPDLSRFKDATIDEYITFLTGRHYNFRLLDGSLIQISYDLLKNKEISGCRLVWFPCPIDFDEQDLQYATMEELVLTAPNRHIGCRAPMRIDYAPHQVSEDHPTTHLHLGFENFRLPVQRPIEPNRFIRLLIRYRYNSSWRNKGSLIPCEDWKAKDGLTAEDRLIGSLIWDC